MKARASFVECDCIGEGCVGVVQSLSTFESQIRVPLQDASLLRGNGKYHGR